MSSSEETARGGQSAAVLDGEQNPFLRYRERLDAYATARAAGMSDGQFVQIVAELDAAVAEVGRTGFRITPVIDGAALVADATPHLRLSVKVDVANVAGSHKARHLFGVALHLLVAQATTGEPLPERLAIASCGNAALGAATVARALDRRLDVFVPVWADEGVVSMLHSLDAAVHRCERRAAEAGDPSYLRFREAVADGAHSFSVQGTDTPTTFDGGRTLGWEIDEQVGQPDAAYVQVGGGALATAVGRALPATRMHPVQAEGCAPLARAWHRLAPEFDFAAAARTPEAYMVPWENPHSLATGILDDVTYDWLPLLRLTHASGGRPVVAAETSIRSAWEAARSVTGVSVSATGASGLAGLATDPPSDPEHVIIIFTGVDR